MFVLIWPYAVWRMCYCLLPGLPHLCHRMDVRRMARVLLPLAWFDSSLLSYGCTLYGVSIIAFGLGHLIFAIVCLYVVGREYYCLWPGLIHFVIIWAYAVWREHYCLWPGLPHLCHPWLYVVWCEYCCLWPRLNHLCCHIAVRRVARVLLNLAWF